MKKKYRYRVDANKKIGLGHLLELKDLFIKIKI